MKALVTTLMLAIGGMSLADEPGWTSDQRAGQRQAVVDATVTKIEKVRDQPSKDVHLMRAVLKVGSIQKGKDIVGSADTIDILFETSPLGAGYRCPTFPILKTEQRGRFYLRFDAGLSDQKAFVLEMGRDIESIPLDSNIVIPQLTKTLQGTPSFDDLSKILGQPNVDIGSAYHVYIYTLDKGGSITVGASLDKKILYVDRGDKRLYPIKE